VFFLLAVVLMELDSLWTVVPAIVVIVSTMGIVGPAGSARYMSYFHKLSGSASATYTTMMFGGGAALGAATGWFFNGTLLPIALVMATSTCAANAIAYSIPRNHSDAAALERGSAA
jgi:DHA1 family bicyclomycin/chloramphenicol resistance-like MFS transporter